jgi:lipopolysaccharide transport system ATP-binding protein
LSDSVVRFDSVSKKFILSLNRPRTVQEIFLHALGVRRPQLRESFWALRDIDLDIYRGEAVGFLGPNGAGKSTLLKLVSRILYPTTGQVHVRGRISGLLELGTGFHPDLTGRENISLYGSLMGMSRNEIQQKLDAILAFAELEGFIDMPLRHYSSGMYMRLGFSVASHVDPDVLLVDEVLAVGDQAFQQKCLQRVRRMIQDGVTILFVSHDLEAARSICHRAVWMDGGKVRAVGPADQVAKAYDRHVAAHMGFSLQERFHVESTQKPEPGIQRWGSREVEIVSVRLLNSQGAECQTFDTGEPITIQIDFVAHKRVEQPVFGLAIYRGDGFHVTGPNNQQAGLDIPSVQGPGSVTCAVDELPLLTGDYALSVAVYDCSLSHAYDHHHKAYPFSVRGNRTLFGLLEWPGRWEVETGDKS